VRKFTARMTGHDEVLARYLNHSYLDIFSSAVTLFLTL
jgi:hypothetical protein